MVIGALSLSPAEPATSRFASFDLDIVRADIVEQLVQCADKALVLVVTDTIEQQCDPRPNLTSIVDTVESAAAAAMLSASVLYPIRGAVMRKLLSRFIAAGVLP
jgi:hypothetical protein